MPDTLSEQANKSMIDSVRAEKADSFRVGGNVIRSEGKLRVEGGVSYDRKITNLFGLTAYAKAYWNDQPIVPTDKFGYVVGAEAIYKFREK